MKKILLLILFITYLLNSIGISKLNEVYKLYICQTEHELDIILKLEKSNPSKYNSLIKYGKLTPVDAAKKLAGRYVADDKIECNSESELLIEKRKVDEKELEDYCPLSIKKNGHPCK